ncbi:hypothetical protein Achl_4391 (plasmid) [Pseudarthrobacter chlorophenolicus A6]|uniref:Uncharacterized protein n=2 Tax=Pseudarthrobacter chlorophenolicus TaxID=85085 RepID=B8HIU5_PSECP|nr:hypothetical protein Achl_4391 [Pseudarthrobacter chlorophenolicus A6]SDQ16746.1 hypothetical protein SAMN04489738_0448 [Pseudarthrobacter chlorophenolicus]
MSQLDSGWVARWVVALCEPLLETEARIQIEAQMVELVSRKPHWFAAWFSGFLSDVVRSLDPQDPWRNLSIVEGQTVHPDRSPFGTWVDASDVVHVSIEDIRADLGLAALEKPLNENAAQLISVAAQGWDATLTWCEANLVTAATLPPEQGAEFFKTASAALRWAIHRRRLFSGIEDPFVQVSGVSWITRADKMTSGEPWDEARAARHLEANKVQPGTYKQFNPSAE